MGFLNFKTVCLIVLSFILSPSYSISIEQLFNEGFDTTKFVSDHTVKDSFRSLDFMEFFNDKSCFENYKIYAVYYCYFQIKNTDYWNKFDKLNHNEQYKEAVNHIVYDTLFAPRKYLFFKCGIPIFELICYNDFYMAKPVSVYNGTFLSRVKDPFYKIKHIKINKTEIGYLYIGDLYLIKKGKRLFTSQDGLKKERSKSNSAIVKFFQSGINDNKYKLPNGPLLR